MEVFKKNTERITRILKSESRKNNLLKDSNKKLSDKELETLKNEILEVAKSGTATEIFSLSRKVHPRIVKKILSHSMASTLDYNQIIKYSQEIPGSFIPVLEDAIIYSKNNDHIINFASSVEKRVNFKKLQMAVMKSQNLLSMISFSNRVFETNKISMINYILNKMDLSNAVTYAQEVNGLSGQELSLIENAVIAHGTPAHICDLACAHFTDKKRLRKSIEKMGDPTWLEVFDLNLKHINKNILYECVRAKDYLQLKKLQKQNANNTTSTTYVSSAPLNTHSRARTHSFASNQNHTQMQNNNSQHSHNLKKNSSQNRNASSQNTHSQDNTKTTRKHSIFSYLAAKFNKNRNKNYPNTRNNINEMDGMEM